MTFLTEDVKSELVEALRHALDSFDAIESGKDFSDACAILGEVNTVFESAYAAKVAVWNCRRFRSTNKLTPNPKRES